MIMRLLSGMAGVLLAGSAAAFPVGERHMTTTEPAAAIRDAEHRDQLRITVWYPARAGTVEAPLDIGPPGAPLFKPGSAATDAPFADDHARPVILLSHGFGGTARIMAWFGTALARAGYVVIAVDHPGNNAMDPMTVPGAVLFWERPGDLASSLARVRSEPGLAPHLDLSRLGVAGFSAGGFTALAAAGGRVDLQRYRIFCEANPTDGVCRPQKEFAVSLPQAEAFLRDPVMAEEVARSQAAMAIPGVKGAFVMAPAIVQAFDPASLADIHMPVSIVLGDADEVAAPATNGEAVARLIPGARIKVLPGAGHYDFLSECTPQARATIPLCRTAVAQPSTHRAALDDALDFFAGALK